MENKKLIVQRNENSRSLYASRAPTLPRVPRGSWIPLFKYIQLIPKLSLVQAEVFFSSLDNEYVTSILRALSLK